jgi:hypothetical protein
MNLGDYRFFIMQVIHLLKPIQKEQKWTTLTFDKQKSLMQRQITKTKKEKNYEEDQDMPHRALMAEVNIIFLRKVKTNLT